MSADVHICLCALGLQWEESDEGGVPLFDLLKRKCFESMSCGAPPCYLQNCTQHPAGSLNEESANASKDHCTLKQKKQFTVSVPPLEEVTQTLWPSILYVENGKNEACPAKWLEK